MSGIPLKLSDVKPDFDALVMQLQVYLNSKSTWIDLLASSTGETLIEMMAAVGAFNQFAVESGAREGFLSTAVRESSIYAISRMLGVRIARKSPASTSVTLTRPTKDKGSPMALPRFSQFTVGGKPFFNRESAIFNSGSTTCSIELYEGQVRTESFAASSTSFREVFLAGEGFGVSNFDVRVELMDNATGALTVWTPINEGIWTAGPGDNVYYDSTSGLGEAVLAFGDGYHGALPSIGNTILVTYAVTTGTVGNNGVGGQAVLLDTFPELSGLTTNNVSGGADEKPASYYKSLAPHLYKARTRAVTPEDYRAIVTSYPNVSSCVIQTQKDIAPYDLRWMNVVRICILPQDTSSQAFTTAQWNDFRIWFLKTSHAAIQIQTYDPIRLARNVSVRLALRNNASIGDIKPVVDANIRALFKRGLATLGKRIAISDIVRAASITGVDYVDVLDPTSDLVPPEGVLKTLNYFDLGVLTISAEYSERMYYNNAQTVS